MPLPRFDDYRTVWVEKTKASHGHGGEGWEFGTCLWSPTTNTKGHRIYKNMVAAKDGDLVLHFYEDAPYGKAEDHYFVGISIVDGDPETKKEAPPRPGEWAGRPEYYRVNLRSFASFADILPLTKFVQDHEGKILQSLGEPDDQPFINYNGRVRLAQGKYLSRSGRRLYSLLSDAIGEEVELSSAPTAVKGATLPVRNRRPFDYEEYVEGQRSKKETSFFARNPKLVRDAKDHYGYQCQACQFRYETKYPELGNGFIEVHHLDPLSERDKANASPRLTRLDQVTVMCADCHRMIHRLIRTLGRPVSLEEFRSRVKTTS